MFVCLSWGFSVATSALECWVRFLKTPLQNIHEISEFKCLVPSNNCKKEHCRQVMKFMFHMVSNCHHFKGLLFHYWPEECCHLSEYSSMEVIQYNLILFLTWEKWIIVRLHHDKKDKAKHVSLNKKSVWKKQEHFS